MPEVKYSASKKMFYIALYSGSKRVKTFWSSKPGLAGRREVLAKYNDFIGGRDSALSVSAEFSRFLEDLAARVAPETLENNRSLIKNYILPELGPRRLASVRLTDWQRVINNARKRDGSLLSKKSYCKIRATIVQFLRYCQLDGLDVPNGSVLYVPKNADVVGKQVLPDSAIAALFDDSGPASDCFYVHYFRTLLLLGCRPGEVLGLKWSDVSEGWLTISRSINTAGRITSGKNKNARRRLKLSHEVLRELDAQAALTAGLGSPWIFCNYSGAQGSQKLIYKSWRRLADKIGAPGTSLYSFRFTYVSLQAPTMPLPLLRSVLGHSVNMDSYHYLRENDVLRERAAEVSAVNFENLFEKLNNRRLG